MGRTQTCELVTSSPGNASAREGLARAFGPGSALARVGDDQDAHMNFQNNFQKNILFSKFVGSPRGRKKKVDVSLNISENFGAEL